MELVDYEQYVLANNFTDSKKVKYYSGWVRKYFTLKLSDKLSNREKIQQFRDYLNVDEKLEDWQRDQAQRAVEIYLNMFLKSVGEFEMDGDLRYSQILENMKNSMRLKHYAYRTEQTYLDWVNSTFQYPISNTEYPISN